MKCPSCGGDMWDNRESKKSPKHPDFKCKDKNCIDPASGYVTAVWVEDDEGQAPAGGTGPGKPNTPPPPPTPQKNPAHQFDAKAFKDSIDDVKLLRAHAAEGKHGWEVPPDNASQWVTALFIQRMRG